VAAYFQPAPQHGGGISVYPRHTHGPYALKAVSTMSGVV